MVAHRRFFLLQHWINAAVEYRDRLWKSSGDPKGNDASAGRFALA
jgi:hypothetical protein